MCGIVGYTPFTDFDAKTRIVAFQNLFEQSTIRGMHAYGLADYDSNGLLSVKRSFEPKMPALSFNPLRVSIAHARYCQSGDWRILENNQPIVVARYTLGQPQRGTTDDNMALAMNGVISMGTKEEYEAEFGVTCAVDNDSEIFLRKLEQGVDAGEFIGSITGSFAATWLRDGQLFAGRNARRPLWKCLSYGALWYASTEDIFKRAGFVGAAPVPVGFESALESTRINGERRL